MTKDYFPSKSHICKNSPISLLCSFLKMTFSLCCRLNVTNAASVLVLKSLAFQNKQTKKKIDLHGFQTSSHSLPHQ